MEWDLSIVLVVYKYSVVAKAIERKLAECGYNVVVVAEDYGRLKDMADTALLFIIYLPGDIADDQKEVERWILYRNRFGIAVPI